MPPADEKDGNREALVIRPWHAYSKSPQRRSLVIGGEQDRVTAEDARKVRCEGASHNAVQTLFCGKRAAPRVLSLFGSAVAQKNTDAGEL